ncbi:MAG: hypothetical protein WEB30_18270 [Cyclobacteriaceae bacterium]
MHHKYEVKEQDMFDQVSYPEVIKELETINENTRRMSGNNKSDIVISFLKDHCINMDWVERNPKLVKYITSRSLVTAHIESLFESCRGNRPFLSGFEACIRKQLE